MLQKDLTKLEWLRFCSRWPWEYHCVPLRGQSLCCGTVGRLKLWIEIIWHQIMMDLTSSISFNNVWSKLKCNICDWSKGIEVLPIQRTFLYFREQSAHQWEMPPPSHELTRCVIAESSSSRQDFKSPSWNRIREAGLWGGLFNCFAYDFRKRFCKFCQWTAGRLYISWSGRGSWTVK